MFKIEKSTTTAAEDQMDSNITRVIMKEAKPDNDDLQLLTAQMMEQQERAQFFHIPIRAGLERVSISDKPIDDTSIAGKFGWAQLGREEPDQLQPNKSVIPFIYRYSEMFCSERILKQKLVHYQSLLHSDIGICSAVVPKKKILEAEVRLHNEINSEHCDGQFGEKFTGTEKLLRLTDAVDCYQFLEEVHRMLTSKTLDPVPRKCGFFRGNDRSVFPFVLSDGQYLVPLFYFKNVSNLLMTKSKMIRDWDLSYLKFCCRLQGIPTDLMKSQSMLVISLNEIQKHLKGISILEYYWPSTAETSTLLAK